MDIDIEKYLTEDEIKEIVISKFKESIVFDDENDIKRIITNTSFELVWEKVDSVFDEEIEIVLRDKIKSIILGMTDYNIFKKPDAWDKETNSAYDFLQACIEKEKENIKSIVKTNLPVEVMQSLKENMKELIQESIQEFYLDL